MYSKSSTLLGLPNLHFWKCLRQASNLAQKRIGFLGVPFGKGQKEGGVKRLGLELAPDAIRSTSLIQQLQQNGIDVKDFGNVVSEPSGEFAEVPSMVNYNEVVANLEKVSQRVGEILRSDRVCLTVGGDHSIFTGTLHGHMETVGADNVAVVYVDAHADINLCTTSPSGNVHGMCVALAALQFKEDWVKLPKLEWLKSRLPLQNLGYIGLRSVDPPETQAITKHGITAFTTTDVVRYGIPHVVENVLKKIDPENKKSIHLSIDTDSLDPSEAPCTTIPVRGGLLLRELLYLAETLAKTNRIRAIDWVELNPLLGSEEERLRTLEAARGALLACFSSLATSN